MLEDDEEKYTFVIDIIKRAIEINKINNNDPANQLVIVGFIFHSQFQSMINVCNTELDLFSKFGFTVMVSETLNINDEVQFVCC